MAGLFFLGAIVLGWSLLDAFDDGADGDREAASQDDEFDTVERGSALADSLSGTDGEDLLIGLGGDDTLSGGTGDDDLRGWAGQDELFGESGDDALSGGFGNDMLSGGGGADLLDAGAGSDSVFGEAGEDSLNGGTGSDYLDGGEDEDVVRGDEGDDQLIGGMGSDTLFGEEGNDAFLGGPRFGTTFGLVQAVRDEPDYLDGGEGDDTINAEDGDQVVTGTGSDVVEVSLWDVADGVDAVRIADFNRDEDVLILEGDDRELRLPPPRGPDDIPVDPVSVAPYENGDGYTVFVNGAPVVHLDNVTKFSRADVVLST